MRKRYSASFFLGAEDAAGPAIEEVAAVCTGWVRAHALVDPVLGGKLQPGASLPRTDLGDRAWCQAHRTEASGTEYWGVRYEHFDTESDDTIWRTDLCVSRDDDGQTAFACTNWFGGVSASISPVRRDPSRPRPVREVLERWGGYKGPLPLLPFATEVTADDTPALLEAIRTFHRQRPLVFVSARRDDDRPLVDAHRLADWLAGLAHVMVAADRFPAQRLEGELPREFLCYDGAVRVYWPQLDLTAPRQNRMWLPHVIRKIDGSRVNGFSEHVLGYIAENSAYIEDPESPSWALLEWQRRSDELAAAGDDGDFRQLAEEFARECDELRDENGELTRQVGDLQVELSKAQAALDAVQDENRRLIRIYGVSAEPEAVQPQTVAEAIDLAQERWPDGLAFAMNSRSDASRSQFDNAADVLKVFGFLATTYRDAKLGLRPEPDLAGALRRLVGWEYAPRQSVRSTGQFADWYRTTWNGRRYDLQEHVGKGTSRDPRYTIRIAFFWDPESKLVVIGFIGQHQRSVSS